LEPTEGTGLIDAPEAGSPAGPLLDVRQLTTGYGRKTVVFGVDLHVAPGEVVGIIGHNGAGKTTTLRGIFGSLPVQSGSVTYQGVDITRRTPRRNVQDGISLIPSEHFVFADMSVRDNLLLGALHEKSSTIVKDRMTMVHDLLPILAERSDQLAGTFSGGQQRLLSLGTSLMSGPRLLLLDEPSLGIAPALVTTLFGTIRRFARDQGLSVLILEQNIGQLLKIVDRVYVMRSGRVILEETVEQMRARSQYWDLF
jgi:branched-chain amino acid transport system ATP-binding protein